MWFHEFFDGDSGRGLGASHQCGWTGLIAKVIHDTGINCRLPQTPRTPSTAAAHYFDDVFSNKSRKNSVIGGKPHHFRRSSTHRSIGKRSSFTSSANGEGDEAKSVANSALEDEYSSERRAADEHVVSYVTDQLERIRSNESAPTTYEDEFEAQLDEK